MFEQLYVSDTVDWREKNIKTFGIDPSFSDIPEWKRTKHVHRLHPYLGKFIPQIVEIFLRKYFKKGQIILDPFVGSGTTLIESNILGLDSIGIHQYAFGLFSFKEFSDIEMVVHLMEEARKQRNNIKLTYGSL
ncbi:MAG TPA: hypothetical protein EYP86_03315 [Candidatus Altiarchaeales archaeon]|nr:hypothetical protein [Candidatus Altiarchaeales archaeon]